MNPQLFSPSSPPNKRRGVSKSHLKEPRMAQGIYHRDYRGVITSTHLQRHLKVQVILGPSPSSWPRDRL